jgi:soluble lytic murein transglycosylase
MLVWSPKLLETTSCPRNLSAAALRKIENLMPSPAAFNMMEKLYAHATACLKPDDEGYEMTHFRQGLLRILMGKETQALLPLRKAALAIHSAEKSRVLFWAGLYERNLLKRKKYWGDLIEKYPLSFHALEAWNHLQMDPFEIFSKRPVLELTRSTLGNSESIDISLRWLELLYLQGHVESAQKLSRWLTENYRDQISPTTLLYVSSLKSSRGTPLNTITFLTRQVGENPVILNQQTLKLLFPKPYFDIFEKASPQTDTFLILSVARQESGFNPKARSIANARGLLQVLPATARVLTGKKTNDLYNAEFNAEIGVRFLSQLINKMGGVELALAAYNAGPGRIPEWKERFPTDNELLFLDLIPFKETRNYVSAILRNNYWYERLYSNDPAVLAQRTLKEAQQKSRRVGDLIEGHMRQSLARAPAGI